MQSAMPKEVTILEFNDSVTEPPFLKIFRHYVLMFHKIFDEYKHSHLLVLEDDLLISPSILSFLDQTSRVLDKDPSLLCISLFNDNA